MQKNVLYLVDGHGVIFRSYYAYMKNPLRNSQNQNTSAIYGFFQSIKKIFDTYKPTHFAIVFDPKGPSFRKDIYPKYKANRHAAPEDLVYQIPIIMDIIKALEMPSISVPKYEADDVLASIAEKRSKKQDPTVVISNDKDLLQILTTHTNILRPSSRKPDLEKVDIKWLKENWQLSPEQILDYLALVGDVSDNVPGVAGVGEKTALALLHEYGSLKNIYKNIADIKSGWQKKLVENEENAHLSYTLVSLKKDVPLPPINFSYPSINWHKAHHIFTEHEIFAFTKRSDSSTSTSKTKTTSQKLSETKTTPSTDTTRDNKPGVYHLVKNIAEIDAIVAKALKNKKVCLDLETTTLNVFSTEIVGIAMSVAAREGFYIPLKAPQQDADKVLPEKEVKKALLPLFKTGDCMLIFHNSKFDLPILQRWGLKKTPHKLSLFDTLVAGWLCNTSLHNYSMDYLSSHFLSYQPIPYSSLTDATAPEEKAGEKTKQKKFDKSFDVVALKDAVPYAAEDADITFRLYKCFSTILKKNKLEDVFFNLEMPITKVLIKMEQHGIGVDPNYLLKLSKELESIQLVLEKEIYSLCGKEFNIKSTKQLQEVLFKDLGLTPIKKNQSGFSTDVGVLTQLSYKHDVPKKILEYRHVAKLQNTYTDTLPEQIDETTGRIHTSFNQNGSETGRISSINPNLQNIPAKDALGKKIRRAFVSKKDHVFISADYSQIELVVLAHLSGDKNLIQSFKNMQDIHKNTASLLMNVAVKDVSEEQRRIAKSINFGIIYGMSAFRLSNELRIPRALAVQFIEEYFIQFSGVASFIKQSEEQAHKFGYVETIVGRRRELPFIYSKNKILQNAAKRMAVNTRIQGSAADIVKLAMLKVEKELQAQKLQSLLLLQIHDELLLECPKNEEEKAITLVTECMQDAYKLSVPLNVSTSIGKNWGELK